MKHTAAPWKIDNTFGRPRVFVEDNGNKKILFNASGDTELEESEANAKLIAAAPELLEALSQLVGHLPPTFDRNYYVKQAKSAISKAEGI